MTNYARLVFTSPKLSFNRFFENHLFNVLAHYWIKFKMYHNGVTLVVLFLLGRQVFDLKLIKFKKRAFKSLNVQIKVWNITEYKKKTKRKKNWAISFRFSWLYLEPMIKKIIKQKFEKQFCQSLKIVFYSSN